MKEVTKDTILEMLNKLEEMNNSNRPKDKETEAFLRGYDRAIKNIRFIVSAET